MQEAPLHNSAHCTKQISHLFLIWGPKFLFMSWQDRCPVPVAVLEPGPLLELENAGECWRMLEIPEVQSLAILNFLNLEHL